MDVTAFIHWRTSRVLLVLTIRNQAPKHLYTDICVKVSFYFSGINAEECNARIGKVIFRFLSNGFFPEWLYHITFPTEIFELSSCFASISTFGIASIFYISHLIGVYHCGLINLSLMNNNVKYFIFSPTYLYMELQWGNIILILDL